MKTFGQFCPLAQAAQLLCERWTLLVVRELVAGSTRFSDLQRGVPLMSPTLLSARLKQLTAAGVVARTGNKGKYSYELTEAGRELTPVVQMLGAWGHRWLQTTLVVEDLDASLLMWDMRRRIDVKEFPKRRVVISFMFMDMPSNRRAYWLIVDQGEVDLCIKYPGFDTDLEFVTTSKAMADVWMGYSSLKQEIRKKNLTLSGGKDLKNSIDDWFNYSVFSNPKELRESLS